MGIQSRKLTSTEHEALMAVRSILSAFPPGARAAILNTLSEQDGLRVTAEAMTDQELRHWRKNGGQSNG